MALSATLVGTLESRLAGGLDITIGCMEKQTKILLTLDTHSFQGGIHPRRRKPQRGYVLSDQDWGRLKYLITALRPASSNWLYAFQLFASGALSFTIAALTTEAAIDDVPFKLAVLLFVAPIVCGVGAGICLVAHLQLSRNVKTDERRAINFMEELERLHTERLDSGVAE